MNFTQLKEIFSEARLCDHPSQNEQELSYFHEGKWIILPRAALTKREIQVLDKLYHQISHTSAWFDMLILGTPTLPESNDLYTIIQFNGDTIHDSDQWLHVLSDYFGNIIDSFFVTPTYGLLVHKGIIPFDVQQFEAMLGPLNEDFATKASFYIGLSHPLNHRFIDVFKAEQDLFLKHGSPSPTTNFLKIYLPALIKPILEHHPVSMDLKAMIKSQTDLPELIKILWESKGNISSSAQALYLHRNTLVYRIEKFYELTGLNLKNLDDLLLCYLLIL